MQHQRDSAPAKPFPEDSTSYAPGPGTSRAPPKFSVRAGTREKSTALLTWAYRGAERDAKRSRSSQVNVASGNWMTCVWQIAGAADSGEGEAR